MRWVCVRVRMWGVDSPLSVLGSPVWCFGFVSEVSRLLWVPLQRRLEK